MKILINFISFSSLALFSSMIFAQEAGDAVKLEYGKVESKQTVQAKGERAAGTMVGGVAGAAIAKDHRGLGALAGGLLGGGIQKHQTRDTLEQYTVAFVSGGRVVIDTEQ